MSWKYGDDLDEKAIEKEEEDLRNFVKKFDDIGPVHAFNKACEYISNHAKKGSIMPNISDIETIVAINASGKAITLLVGEQEDIDEDTLQSIQSLSSALEQMLEKMDNNHKKFMAVFSDDNALYEYKEIHDNAMTLLRSLHGMFAFRTASEVDEFKEHVHSIQRNPYSICTNVMSFLQCDETNPLIVLLNANPFKTNKAMYLWSLCVVDLFVSMGIAYIVHEGVKGRDFATFAQLQDLSPIYALNSEMMTFNQSYKVDFWPELVRTLIEETADNNEEESNAKKAEILDIKLSQISNFDYGFLIIVHDEASGENEHIFITDQNNVLYRFNRAGCCILVYRTCFHKTRTAEEVTAMCTQAQEKKQELFCGPEDQLKERARCFFDANPNAGFVGAIKKKLNADVRLICADRHKQALLSMESTCVRSKTWQETFSDFGSGYVSEDSEIVVLPRQELGDVRGDNYLWFTSRFD